MKSFFFPLAIGLMVASLLDGATPQYKSPEITVAAASAKEPVLKEFSLAKANDYLEKGALAWARKRDCVACHTSGAYMQIRPELTPILGKPTKEIHEQLADKLKVFQEMDRAKLLGGTNPAELTYIAAGFAEWDKHVAGKLSPATDAALRLMFSLQQKNGTWGSATCWPPIESSAYQVATVAAMAAATAPGWLEGLKDKALKQQVESMQNYLRNTEPPHDYGKLVLLWANTRMPGLISDMRKKKIMDTLWKHQRKDGGWSIRTFSVPEKWGGGNRAQKLRAEPEFKNPPSDGHQTGLVMLVLSEAGVPAKDKRLQKGVNWLLANQRESGRWWTRSLSTDKYHLITYSGTVYPLLALAKCGALPMERPALR